MLQRNGGVNRACKATILCGVVIAMGLTAGTGQALADSVTLSVTTTTGASDPAADVARVFTLSGTSSLDTYVWVKYRAPGGAPCAPSASTDTGDSLQIASTGYYGRTVNGAFSISAAGTWRTPGTFIFCYWLSDSSSAVSTPLTQSITFRVATGTITATVNPVTPMINQTATITITGATETPAYVFATVRPAGGAPCAPTYSADSGEGLIGGRSVNGAFSVSQTLTRSTPGNYLLCLWLAQSSSDPSPIAGPQPQTFSVAGPPVVVPPTRVPASATIRRRGSRYSGRISTRSDCRSRRTVVLRRTGSGTKSFGRAFTRSNGTFTIQRSRRLRGRVYVVVSARGQSGVVCSFGRSGSIRG